jgi:hypothetical protein
MKKKSSGGGSQINGLTAPGVLLTLSILMLKSVPDPFSGVKSFEKAEIFSVLIGPGPGRTLPVTFQLLPVSPKACVGGLEKVTTVESKEILHSNPTMLSLVLICETVTGSMITVAMGTDVSKVSVGRVTVIVAWP